MDRVAEQGRRPSGLGVAKAISPVGKERRLQGECQDLSGIVRFHRI
jgi:hypothetical protein